MQGEAGLEVSIQRPMSVCLPTTHLDDGYRGRGAHEWKGWLLSSMTVGKPWVTASGHFDIANRIWNAPNTRMTSEEEGAPGPDLTDHRTCTRAFKRHGAHKYNQHVSIRNKSMLEKKRPHGMMDSFCGFRGSWLVGLREEMGPRSRQLVGGPGQLWWVDSNASALLEL